jgi:hypothetical protein
MNEPPIFDRLLGPLGPELGCDECFDNIDAYVEMELSDSSRFETCATCVSPEPCGRERHCLGMRSHFSGCPACAEEYQSLKALLRDGPTLQPPPD